MFVLPTFYIHIQKQTSFWCNNCISYFYCSHNQRLNKKPLGRGRTGSDWWFGETQSTVMGKVCQWEPDHISTHWGPGNKGSTRWAELRTSRTILQWWPCFTRYHIPQGRHPQKSATSCMQPSFQTGACEGPFTSTPHSPLFWTMDTQCNPEIYMFPTSFSNRKGI